MERVDAIAAQHEDVGALGAQPLLERVDSPSAQHEDVGALGAQPLLERVDALAAQLPHVGVLGAQPLLEGIGALADQLPHEDVGALAAQPPFEDVGALGAQPLEGIGTPGVQLPLEGIGTFGAQLPLENLGAPRAQVRVEEIGVLFSPQFEDTSCFSGHGQPWAIVYEDDNFDEGLPVYNLESKKYAGLPSKSQASESIPLLHAAQAQSVVVSVTCKPSVSQSLSSLLRNMSPYVRADFGWTDAKITQHPLSAHEMVGIRDTSGEPTSTAIEHTTCPPAEDSPHSITALPCVLPCILQVARGMLVSLRCATVCIVLQSLIPSVTCRCQPLMIMGIG
jgi:hypothetical protein